MTMSFVECALSEHPHSNYGSAAAYLHFVLDEEAYPRGGATATMDDQSEKWEAFVLRESDEKTVGCTDHPEHIWKFTVEHPDFTITIEHFAVSAGSEEETISLFNGDYVAADEWLTANFQEDWRRALEALYGEMYEEDFVDDDGEVIVEKPKWLLATVDG